MSDAAAFSRREMGERIHRTRVASGVSAAQLARLLQVSTHTVKLIETGERRMFADEMLKVSDLLKVNLQYLFGRTP